MNKSSSTVWLRHRPTGIKMRCERELSQVSNRELSRAELGIKQEERQRGKTKSAHGPVGRDRAAAHAGAGRPELAIRSRRSITRV